MDTVADRMMDPERYYKYFEGILPGMTELMTGENSNQTPWEAIERACENESSVLALYQEKLAKLEEENPLCDYALGKALIEDFASLCEVLHKIKDRPAQVPLNPILCGILMSAAFAQSRVLRTWFDNVR